MLIEELREFGVSDSIIDRLKELGFESLTRAQEEAVGKGLFTKKSLLISAPTNTGKTFIGELAALNASRQKDPKRSFFLVPLKALAEQMFRDFQDKYSTWGLKVAISTADHYEYDNDLTEYDVIISTYEKLNGLVVKRPEITDAIGLVVVDEIQHIGDESRGIPLEMLLTRLKVFTRGIQIIGLSATISNAKSLADWLGCILVEIDKRDVELREGVLYTGNDQLKFRGHVLNDGDFLYKEFNSGKIGVEEKLSLNRIAVIIKQSKTEQCLVFVNTQSEAEKKAEMIARDLPNLPETDKLIDEINATVESTPITAKLKKVLTKGIAFHHAGLLTDERRIVEAGFREGLISVICSTPTLAAGINTPAKNVIILFSHYWDGTPMPVSAYKNISGRAARLRKAEAFGRSLLLADTERNLESYWDNYINAKPETVVSQISKSSGLDCSILVLVSSKTCSVREELSYCLEETFFGFIASTEMASVYKNLMSKTINQEVDKLIKMGLINENGKLVATELGLRCAEELLSPESTVFLYSVLATNEGNIKNETDFVHLIPRIIHLCCCTNDSDVVFPPRSQTEKEELDAIWKLNSASYFFKPQDRTTFLRSLRTTRMLLRWIEGVPYHELTQYAPPGVIMRIAENIHWISRSMAYLAKKPLFTFNDEFTDFLFELSERIYFGVPKEALAVMRLRVQGVHRRRAMNLAKDGYQNLDSLLQANIEDLEKVDDIGKVLATRIKEATEKFLDSESQKQKSAQLRLAAKLNKNKDIILGLYSAQGDDFARHIAKVLREEFKMDASFVGDKSPHEPDIIVKTEKGDIAIEAKRHKKDTVTTLESEEILGKGAKYAPIANVTIGYPDFTEAAKQSVINSKVTLIKAAMLGEIIVQYWTGKMTTEDILALFGSGRNMYDVESYCLEQK